jgi:hypothetical protein
VVGDPDGWAARGSRQERNYDCNEKSIAGFAVRPTNQIEGHDLTEDMTNPHNPQPCVGYQSNLLIIFTLH